MLNSKYVNRLTIIFIAIFGVLMMSTPSDAAPTDDFPSSLEFEGSDYTLLKGDELVSMVAGRIIRSGGNHFIEKFYKNGRYERTGALVPEFGSYSISQGSVFVERIQMGSKSRTLIYKNNKNEYIMIDLYKDKESPAPSKIIIETLPE
jgi:hypothetical protein